VAVRSLLRFDDLVPVLIQYFRQVADCVATRESQVVEDHFGIQKVKRDIGCQFRLNALEAIMAFQKRVPEQCPFEDLFAVVVASLDLTQADDVKIRGLGLLTDLVQGR
jgi:hypothetical protein